MNSKSDAFGRIVFLDNDITKVLRAHRERQNQARRARGNAWVDSGLVVTNADGSPLHPATIRTRFQELIAQAGLPPIRLHDLRHGAATLTEMGGVASDAALDKIRERLLSATSPFGLDHGWLVEASLPSITGSRS